MIIQTKRLNLRAFKDEDIVWCEELFKSKDIKDRLTGIYADNLKDAERNIEIFKQGDFENDFYYVIEDNETNQVVGIIIAIRLGGRIIDVSYFLYEEHRHKGYMHEALEKFMRCARIKNPVYVFRMEIEEKNEESLNVVRKFGAEIEKKENKYMCYL